MRFFKFIIGGAALVVGWQILKDRTSRPCHNCGRSGFLTGWVCADCREPTCTDHMGLVFVCADCARKLTDAVKTSTTQTIPGYAIVEVIGVVTVDAELSAEMAVYRLQVAAHKREANGIIDLKVDALGMSKGGLSYLARGTAVKIQPETRCS